LPHEKQPEIAMRESAKEQLQVYGCPAFVLGVAVPSSLGYLSISRFGVAPRSCGRTFTVSDRGSHTFNNLVLGQAGDNTLTSMDTGDPTVSGSVTFTVAPA
jgi:hypothetical protein